MTTLVIKKIRSSFLLLVFGALAGIWACGAAPASGAPAATEVRLGVDGPRTRFVMEFTDRLDITVFALPDPYRVIIDMPQADFRLPANAGQEGQGLVKAFRFGLLAVGRSRIVLDVHKPVEIASAQILDGDGEVPVRLVVDLLPTSREAFLRTWQAQGSRERKPAPAQTTAAVTMPILRPQISEKPVVTIDPGHGGIDPGAIAVDGVSEKDVVLAFAKVLREKLNAIGCCVVHLTREGDVFMALRERIAAARSQGASLFISVHADKFRHSEVRGATVYTLSERASDKEAAALARSENKADLIAGLDLVDEPDEVTDILIDLAQRETKNFSIRFAKGLVRTMDKSVKLNKNPHRFAGFTVLRAPDVPSVLLELGYLSNANDTRQLTTEAWRDKAAESVAQAIAGYFRVKPAR